VNSAPTLSVVIATTGRPTLLATLESLRQLRSTDEIVLISDGDHPQALAMLKATGLTCATRHLVHQPQANDWGHTPRNLYSHLATKDRVLHMDDDDLYLDGAIEVMRAECAKHPDRLVVFQMLTPHGRIPATHEIRIGNIDTKCGALPNIPEKWGRWEPFHGAAAARMELSRGGEEVSPTGPSRGCGRPDPEGFPPNLAGRPSHAR
jgi:hypothetical protein